MTDPAPRSHPPPPCGLEVSQSLAVLDEAEESRLISFLNDTIHCSFQPWLVPPQRSRRPLSCAIVSPAGSARFMIIARKVAVVGPDTRYVTVLVPLHESDIEHWSLASLDFLRRSNHGLGSAGWGTRCSETSQRVRTLLPEFPRIEREAPGFPFRGNHVHHHGQIRMTGGLPLIVALAFDLLLPPLPSWPNPRISTRRLGS